MRITNEKFGLILFSFFCIGFYCSCQREKDKGRHAYILTQQLFEDYEGTKEYAKKVESMEFKQKNLLDSLGLAIKLAEGRLPSASPELKLRKEEYNRLFRQVYTGNKEEINRYNAQLWKQINEYVKEYGMTNGYSFIHGANGTGNIMFADTSLDITAKVTKYINGKYAGK